MQSWAIRQLAFISRYCGLVGVAVRKLEALPEEPVLIPRARVASRSPIVPAMPPAPAKRKARTDCRRFRQIRFCCCLVELLCAVLGYPTACLYLKVLRIGWSCCSQAWSSPRGANPYTARARRLAFADRSGDAACTSKKESPHRLPPFPANSHAC